MQSHCTWKFMILMSFTIHDTLKDFIKNTNMKEHLKPQIRQLKDLDLFRGVCKRDIFPVTSTSAVLSLDKEGNPIPDVQPVLEDRLKALEQTAACSCEEISNEDIQQLFQEIDIE